MTKKPHTELVGYRGSKDPGKIFHLGPFFKRLSHDTYKDASGNIGAMKDVIAAFALNGERPVPVFKRLNIKGARK